MPGGINMTKGFAAKIRKMASALMALAIAAGVFSGCESAGTKHPNR